MKKLIFIVSLVLIFLSTTSLASEKISEVDALKKQLDRVYDLAASQPLIKNQADLTFYQAIDYPEFPLNAFSNEHVRQDFIESIRFSEKGLAGFNSETLTTLSYADAYKLLSLFGQSYLAEHIVSPEVATNKSTVIKPYLSNAEYPILAQVRAIDNLDKSDTDRLAAFKAFYQNTLTPSLQEADCSERAHNDTMAVLDAFYLINFYSDDKVMAEQHLACFNAFASHFPDSKYLSIVAEGVYKSLLSSRQLSQAENLQQLYPKMNVGELPKIKSLSINGPSVYRIDSDEKTLVQRAFTFKTEPEVIVIAHPYCHFCQFMIKDINADKVLKAFFKQHSRWLADENYLDHVDALMSWNKEYPMARLDIAYLKQDFTQLDNWGTPTIYFLVDGKVVDKIVGWPQQGQKELLNKKIKNHFPGFKG